MAGEQQEGAKMKLGMAEKSQKWDSRVSELGESQRSSPLFAGRKQQFAAHGTGLWYIGIYAPSENNTFPPL